MLCWKSQRGLNFLMFPLWGEKDSSSHRRKAVCLEVKVGYFSVISKPLSPFRRDAASYRNSSDVSSINLFPIKNTFLIPSLSTANARNEVFGSGRYRIWRGWRALGTSHSPSPVLPGSWVDVDGREQPGHCPLLIPGCSRAENAALCHNMTNPVSINSTKKVWSHK